MNSQPHDSDHQIEFRPALADETDQILEFWARSAEDADRPADTPAAVRRLILRDPDALVLALDGPEIVGSIIAGWDGWRCHLYRLAIAPTHRRRGIAAALIAEAQHRLTTLGGTRADAMVLDTNTEAHPTWTAAGYTLQPTWSRWTKPLPPPPTAPGAAIW
ncbi:GNAT family N-acetyltransferase [Kribbella sandramycini]|uniref:GNAT family N-acetyltransferase n=1 Tax=Kribbella sandramycini TaxID=60450 RepID=A0A7Y4KYZ8_9ACTN|nr:GNAT family N-acetyltransferase [Kribbella sandramycini]MBB6564986.1 ribosomal protein S18 acetylase RimI-like enzyme [Kribbella sandramycini]NOL41258.1 GNAT family N-acetyltransferase [Kribbella sandramycini]